MEEKVRYLKPLHFPHFLGSTHICLSL
jgi:hypothetical protein